MFQTRLTVEKLINRAVVANGIVVATPGAQCCLMTQR